MSLDCLNKLTCGGKVLCLIALHELNEFSGFLVLSYLRCLLVSRNVKTIVFFFSVLWIPKALQAVC